MEWINVNDKEPERTINTTFEVYSKPLLFTDGINVYVGDCFAPRGQRNLRWEGYDIESLIDSGYYSDDPQAEGIENVTHWMLLPDCPKEVKHE